MTTLPVIPGRGSLTLDPRTYAQAQGCVHCGLCLPACPTYVLTGSEADSPRGRIQLMRGMADAVIAATPSVREHLDLCLDCRGCETACPSGVVYHELIEETRARLAEKDTAAGRHPAAVDRFLQWIFFNIFTHPTRLKLALLPARLLQKIGLYNLIRRSGLFRLLPPQLRKMEQMLPSEGRLWPKRLPAKTPRRDTGVPPVLVVSADRQSTAGDPPRRPHGRDARVTTNISVSFFAGCVGSVMFDEVNRKAVDVLSACGANVEVPRAQVCCGAIHHHAGAHAEAQEMARRNIDAFMPENGPAPDSITTTIAGCGAMLREYDVLLRDDPLYAERARQFAEKVRDVTEVIATLELPTGLAAIDETVTYHDACHLAHAQKVTAIPRQLLAQIPSLKMIPLPESDLCCGAAGTYNLTQPEMATRLAERKLANIAATNTTICVTGNVGCAMQIQSEAAARGQKLTVLHPVELLHRAICEQPPH